MGTHFQPPARLSKCQCVKYMKNIAKKCPEDNRGRLSTIFKGNFVISVPFRSFWFILNPFKMFQRLENGWKWLTIWIYLNYNSHPPSSPHQIQSLRHASKILKDLQRFLKSLKRFWRIPHDSWNPHVHSFSRAAPNSSNRTPGARCAPAAQPTHLLLQVL